MWTKPPGGRGNLNGDAITFRFHNPLCQETCRWIASSVTICTSVSFDWLIIFLQSFLLFHVVGKSGRGKGFAGWKTCSLLSSISISGCALTALFAKKTRPSWHHEDKNTVLGVLLWKLLSRESKTRWKCASVGETERGSEAHLLQKADS